MSIDVVDLGPDPWPDLLLFAALWCLPTIAFAVRRQLLRSSPLRRQLSFVVVILGLGAAVYTYRWLSAFEAGEAVFRFGLICGAVALAASAISLLAMRLSQRNESSGVA